MIKIKCILWLTLMADSIIKCHALAVSNDVINIQEIPAVRTGVRSHLC